MKLTVAFLLFLLGFCGFSQNSSSNYRIKKVAVNDTILIDSVSINSNYFFVKTKAEVLLDTSLYSVNFQKALLRFKQPVETDSVIIEYLKFPKFLTKTYQQLDESIIAENNDAQNQLYKFTQSNKENTFVPFNGLTTSGSIARGVTIGNNQNSVLNSELDLQITGKLNDKVSLRASIQDANVPLQESGYSQRLDEFDQVFIELFSERWRVRAGDIDLVNNNSYFANFSKRVQGLNINVDLGDSDNETNIFAAGAVVRGQFTTSQFVAEEGNQGPYKLQGQNGELYVLVVSGSETVYVNGMALKRGESEDYIIDYNAGEIIFNSTFPITSEMRITVDYQFSDRNYSRFVAYGGTNYTSEKLQLGVSVYSENDSKNQPLQQNLSEEQVAILANAGDDASLMVAPSESRQEYDENRILYTKEIVDGTETFVFSTNPEDELYLVTFSYVGENQGDYGIKSSNAINSIFEYLGENLGGYAPITKLVAPTKLQIAVVNGSYTPTEKTQINFEASASKNDLNLFSNLNDGDNNGFAGKVAINQTVVERDSVLNVDAFVDADYISDNFRNIEGLYSPEFNRDWNLDINNITGIGFGLGNQILMNAGVNMLHRKNGIANYEFQHLSFSNGFNGNRHLVNAQVKFNKFLVTSNSSYLNATFTVNESKFLRSYNQLTYSMKKSWLGTKFSVEDNQQRDQENQNLTDLSQRYKSYNVYFGVGDSTKVFAEIGYKNRVNDSIKNNSLQRVNTSNTYYLNSKLIENKHTNLVLFANYRKLDYDDDAFEDENSVNSRMQFSQRLFKQMVQLNINYETNSGRIAEQYFTYVEVEPGQGSYTWLDYNNNGIQELEEFEVAPFTDQGTYIRVLLPNQVYLKTHQNKFSGTLSLNPATWSVSKNKFKKFLSHFYNQTSYLIDRKNLRFGNSFRLNPFEKDEENQRGLQLNFRNVFFFNRGKQRYTTSYTFLENTTQSYLSVGSLSSRIRSHQLNFNHKIMESWLINFLSAHDKNKSESENYSSKNFNINQFRINPKISYLFGGNSSFDLFYQYSNKNNIIDDLERLEQQKYGASFSFASSAKSALNGEFNYFSNAFKGDANTPVAYQMLEGLQPGTNFTWTLLAQKKLTKYLDLNFSYFGRKTETSRVIHTGNIQLKAYF
ncbi:hypothetical protein PW52_11515 [Tamlana sedimentorum]|uniref:Uncharacterized protein n=1 Tax=Neotamlana sedimentorum TaxID=1435349 RepID=A0A0D7W868_9FLAO|nr:hypothetical protein [Tamlana sedimentorum]KJD35286.1 hypothetical protein PW52_11515 [Tamlana sedimentorum]